MLFLVPPSLAVLAVQTLRHMTKVTKFIMLLIYDHTNPAILLLYRNQSITSITTIVAKPMRPTSNHRRCLAHRLHPSRPHHHHHRWPPPSSRRVHNRWLTMWTTKRIKMQVNPLSNRHSTFLPDFKAIVWERQKISIDPEIGRKSTKIHLILPIHFKKVQHRKRPCSSGINSHQVNLKRYRSTFNVSINHLFCCFDGTVVQM